MSDDPNVLLPSDLFDDPYENDFLEDEGEETVNSLSKGYTASDTESEESEESIKEATHRQDMTARWNYTHKMAFPKYASGRKMIPLKVLAAKSIAWDTRIYKKAVSKFESTITIHKKRAAFEELEAIFTRIIKPPQSSKFDPIIIAIDGQHFPVREDRQTEIGLAILDTSIIRGTDPGLYAENWMSHIRTRHIRVWETGTWITYAINKATQEKLWAGDKYNFGASEWYTIGDIYREIHHELRVQNPYPDEEHRQIILIGHGMSNRERHLKLLFGDQAHSSTLFTFKGVGTIQQAFDTQQMLSSREIRFPSLASCLQQYGYSDTIHNNAGNNAVYALMLFLRLASDPSKPDSLVPVGPAATPQDALNRLIHSRLSVLPTAYLGDRCAACGRPSHKKEECVWLNLCLACGKNGFCVHRPRPADWVPDNMLPPTPLVNPPRHPPQAALPPQPVLPPQRASAQGSLSLPKPQLRPQGRRVLIDGSLRASSSPLARPPLGSKAVGEGAEKSTKIGGGVRAKLAQDLSKLALEAGVKPVGEVGDLREVGRVGVKTGSWDVCLRCEEVDHQIKYCPRRKEHYGW